MLQVNEYDFKVESIFITLRTYIRDVLKYDLKKVCEYEECDIYFIRNDRFNEFDDITLKQDFFYEVSYDDSKETNQFITVNYFESDDYDLDKVKESQQIMIKDFLKFFY